jgi:hypothetical protein
MPHALALPVYSDFIIRKSRFIGCVEPCDGREAALARVAQLRAEHPSPSLSLGTTLPNEINNLGDYSGVYGTTFAQIHTHLD